MEAKIKKGCEKFARELARAMYRAKGVRGKKFHTHAQSLGLVKKQKGKAELATVIATCLGVCGLLTLQGCAVKKIDAWPPSIEFHEGWDIHFGTNGISSVDDKRGIGKKAPPAPPAGDRY